MNSHLFTGKQNTPLQNFIDTILDNKRDTHPAIQYVDQVLSYGDLTRLVEATSQQRVIKA